MNWTRFAFASLVGAVVLIAVGLIWHLAIFKGFYDATLMKALNTAMLPQIAIVVEAIRGVVFAYIYPTGYRGGSPVTEGLRFGILMALVSAGIPALYLLTMTASSMDLFWAEMVFVLVQGALAGIAIGMTYGTAAAKPA